MSFRCSAVKCVSDQSDVLKLRTLPKRKNIEALNSRPKTKTKLQELKSGRRAYKYIQLLYLWLFNFIFNAVWLLLNTPDPYLILGHFCLTTIFSHRCSKYQIRCGVLRRLLESGWSYGLKEKAWNWTELL